jgi:nicotinamidase-related amidase
VRIARLFYRVIAGGRTEFVLDPKTTALVLIDLQRGIVSREVAPHTAAEVLDRSAKLAAKIRQSGGTAIYVRVLLSEVLSPPADVSFPRANTGPPPEASDLVPEAGMLPGDVLVTKRQWGAFHGTDLEQQLRRRGIRTIVLGGVATNIGVESTARSAHDLGYELVFAEDAMSSMSAEAHEFPIKNIFPRMGRVRSVEQIMTALG